MPSQRLRNQTLLIDADDTLWENNIYFEQAIDAFIDYLDHSSLTRDQVRAVLDEIELANAGVHGYGSKIFSDSLCQCYQHLVERDIGDNELATVLGFGDQILQQDIVLLPGVADTLEALAKNHKLVMLTKGSEEEQRMKIDRSGIDMHFIDAIVVSEKSESTYRETVAALACRPRSTWMIGNSPKSDINPALAAGLNAVFIPHDWTWSLERQELQTGPGSFMQLARFEDLQSHF